MTVLSLVLYAAVSGFFRSSTKKSLLVKLKRTDRIVFGDVVVIVG